MIAKKILVTEEGITFVNPIFMWIKTERTWGEVDYFFTVREYHRSFGVIESVWLVKDNKLVGRFNELIYSNYTALKNSIPVRYIGEKNLNLLQQLLIRTKIKNLSTN